MISVRQLLKRSIMIWNILQETVTDDIFTVALLLFNIIFLLIIIKKIWVKPQPFGTKVILERSDYHDCQTLEVLQVPFCLSLTIYQAFKDKTTIERLVFGHRYHRSSKYLLPVQNKLSSYLYTYIYILISIGMYFFSLSIDDLCFLVL